MTEPAFPTPLQARAAPRPSTAVAPRSDPPEYQAPTMGFAVRVADATELPHPDRTLDAVVPTRAWRASLAGLISSWPTPSVVVVGAHGDVDVTNSATLTEYALMHAVSSRGLILDLTGVDFFGTEGFSALHRVAVGGARTGTAWSLVPGAVVRRLLAICDPRGSLPAVDTVEGALAAVLDQITATHSSSRAFEHADESGCDDVFRR